MKKAVIGITVNYDSKDTIGLKEASDMGTPGQDWDFVAGDYVYSVERAGGIPLLLPRTENPEILRPMIDLCDGILISGGLDVGPNCYNTRIEGYCGPVMPERDAYELTICRYAYKQKKAILGICRGIQIMNVAFGGTLYQDVQIEGNYKSHSFGSISPRQYPVHKNTIVEDSILARIFGYEVAVNSLHHQAVRAVAPSARATAYSDDGLVEGIEVKGGHPFTVGVQWHPEMMFDSDEQNALFQAFIKACL